MAYTKNTWNTGDIVSSAKLNHMEDGIANSENVFIVGGVTLDQDYNITGTLDKTWQKIHDALQNKICVIVITDGDNVKSIFINSAYDDPDQIGTGGRYIIYAGENNYFRTDSKDGYPIASALA